MIILYYVINDPLFWLMIFWSIFIICLCKLFKAEIFGWFGELWTKQELNKLPRDKYKILNNILIKTNDRTRQIDHIVVSPYGIFVIETKQYNGYITGSKYDLKWERHYGNRPIYYPNPIRQNYGHVKEISKLLNIDSSKIINIVCIPSRANLNINHDGELVRNYTLLDRILSYKNVIIYNCDDVVRIIKNNNITDYNIRRSHKINIRNNKTEFDLNMCPKCGGALIERNGKYSKFLGCSKYPKCKYTRHVDYN